MNRDEKRRLLSLIAFPVHLSAVGKTGSTSDDLKAAARKGAPDFSVLIADSQSAGRGREGRSFYSESGLFMSVLLPCSDEALPFVTHVVAVAVAKAITSVAGEDARVKWVNDVYVKGRKVCGILAENIACESGRRIVLGIGVNIDAPKGGFPSEIADRAGYIECDRAALAAEILNGLFARISRFDKEELRREYAALSFLTGRRVEVLKEGGSKEGIAIGLTNDLGLAVRYGDGSEEDLIAGEVRLVLLDGVRP